MDKHTQRKVFQIAFQAAILVSKIKDMAPQHPEETDAELVIPWSEIQELLSEYEEATEEAWRGPERADNQ